MSREHLNHSSTTVTLFPFLAVLLCTMGVLLLILVVMAKVSRDKALQQAQAERDVQHPRRSAESGRQAEQKLSVLSRRLGKLEQTRVKTKEVLRQDQLKLRHIEDHMRRLEKQLESLQQAAGELELMHQEHSDDRMQAKREISRLHKLIDEVLEEIACVEEELDNGPYSYAIVPYQGARGTRRKPIYIECRGNEVVLQPEGVSLTPRDFAPPLGAGNPLASALRAAREFLVHQYPEMGESAETEPYPLVLVRPDGVGAYYRVRAAIESWDSDFGYEFVESDWKLAFPSADPQLATVESQAVYQARARQRLLAAAAPIAYARRAGGGGMVNNFEVQAGGGRPELMEGDFPSATAEASSPRSWSAAEEMASNGTRQVMSPAETATGRGELGVQQQVMPAGTDGEDQAPGFPELPLAGNTPTGAMQGGGSGGTSVGKPPQFAGELASELGAGAAAHQNSERTKGADPEFPRDDPDLSQGAFGSLARAAVAPDDSFEGGASQAGDQNSAGRKPMNHRNSDPRKRVSERTAGGATAARDDVPASPASGGGPPLPGRMTSSPQNGGAASTSLSLTRPSSEGTASRGGNWAFGGDQGGANTPVSRPIRVIVRRDRLSVLPDRYEMAEAGWIGSGGREVKLQGPTRFAIDELVAGLRDHVQQWGIAGSGLYWRPVLALKVAPDGKARAHDLVKLLKNSGIEIQDTSTAKRVDQPDAKNTR
jgi:hypothetical protein